MGVPEHGLEDATHEVFMVLHRRFDDWDPRVRVTTWLYGIARGVARNALRGQLRTRRKLQAVEANAPGDSGRFTTAEGQMDLMDAARLLEHFVATLDPAKREAFELCAIEGLSTVEAGRCLGAKSSTIATRLRRARALFAAYVRELNAGGR